MYAISQGFKDALASPNQRRVVKAEVLANGVVAAELEILSGTVEVEPTAIRRRLTNLSLVDPAGALVPATAGDLLMPVGNEIRISMGFLGTELVPVGVFGISRPRVTDSGEGLIISLDGYDRARKVRRNRYVAPYTIPAGTNYGTAIQNAILDRDPNAQFNFSSTARTTPLILLEDGDATDPWEEFRKMAASIGMELFADAEGIYVLRPEPNPSTTPAAWSYQEGSQATILEIEKELDDETAYNGFVVIGESSSAAQPVRAEAWDDDPASPTYYLGPYGKVPSFLHSQYVTTQTQAQDAADAGLLRVLGILEDVSFSALVNPAHELGDVIQIKRARMKIDAPYLVHRMSLPLEPERGMRVSTRGRRVA